MCSTPKMPEIKKSIMPQAPQRVEEPPAPVKIDKDGDEKLKRKRNPLRIDLANMGGGGGASTGVNI